MRVILLVSLFLANLLFSNEILFAYTFEYNGIYYKSISEENQTVSVTYHDDGYNRYSGDIIIPRLVFDQSMSFFYKVVSISDKAFYNCDNLTSINVEAEITEIGDSAFYNCKSLISIDLPSSVSSFGNAVFEGCKLLSSFEFPESTEKISRSMFKGCSSITKIVVPYSVSVNGISENAFEDCTSLENVLVFYRKTIPYIQKNAFRNCASLKEFNFEFDCSAVDNSNGSGTSDDPFNVIGILNYTYSLGEDLPSTFNIYFKGIVSKVIEISTKNYYNNASFYISDDGSNNNEFYIFRCLGINKGDIESNDFVKAGDEVLICGKVVYYRGVTPETVQNEAYIVSLNRH